MLDLCSKKRILHQLNKWTIAPTLAFLINSVSVPALADHGPAAADHGPAPAATLHNSPLSMRSAENIRVPKFWEMVTDLPADLKVWNSETFSLKNLPLVLGVTAMTGVLVVTDFESWQAAAIPQSEHNFVRRFANQGVSIGDGFFQFGIVGGFLAVGSMGNRPRHMRAASQVTESILATGIVVQIIKHVTGRESPFSSESRTGVWRMFPDQLDYAKDVQKYDAVPSGHLSTAVTTFIVIQENFPEQKWIPYVGWPVMGWIAYGLAATSIHWWSDYPIAIAVGYSFARIITRENRTRGAVHKDKLNLQPTPSDWMPMIFPTFSPSGDALLMAGWTF